MWIHMQHQHLKNGALISSAEWWDVLCPALVEQHFHNILFICLSVSKLGQIHWLSKVLMNKIAIVSIVVV